MIYKLIIFAFFTIYSFANDIKTIDFKGDIDLLLGDFSKSNLEKVCGISHPTFYKIWQKDVVFTQTDMENCKYLLEEYFSSLSYYMAEIVLTFDENKALFDIKKNEPIKIDSIQIDDEFKNLIELKNSDIFKANNFTNSKKNILRYLNENGYAKAKLDAKAYVDLYLYKVDLIYKVSKNNLIYIGDISIENDAKIDKEFLEKNIDFKKNDIYNIKKIDKTYENLYNFGIYKYISIEPDLERDEDIIPVNIKLVNGEYRETSYGIGYDTDTKFRVKAQYKNENFLGNLKHFTIGAKINSEGYEVYNNFYNPYFVGSDISFNNDISYENKDYKSYSQKKFENKLYFSKEFFGLNNSAGVLLQNSTIKSDLQGYKSGSYLLNSIFYEAILDERDDILNPKNGYYLSFYIENGTSFLASEIDYIKTLSEFRYLKTFDNFTGSFKSKVGTLNKDLPIFKHFFAGGDYSNRGYSYEEVGQKDSDNKPYGGLSMIDSSLEFEYSVKKDFGVVTFFDSTMLSLQTNKFNDTFYNSYGAGIRYYTPIGPLRVDLGFPLKDGGFVLHIGIGQVF